jgi:hypothetical protein
MAGVFGFFWGTHSIWEEEWAQRLGVMLAIAAVIAVSIYAAN